MIVLDTSPGAAARALSLAVIAFTGACTPAVQVGTQPAGSTSSVNGVMSAGRTPWKGSGTGHLDR